MKKGLILLNLGTPDDPSPEAVGRYLREFLMDRYVIDIPWPLRWFLVNVLIVPKRKYASSHAYKTIWSDRGSPLLYHLNDLRDVVLPHLQSEFEIEIAMRYGNPTIEKALRSLQEKNVSEIVVFALYPQYAESTSRSSEECIQEMAQTLGLNLPIRFVPPFYQHPGFINNYAAKIERAMQNFKADHVLMSFHGLPERHVKKTDRSGGQHCLRSADCCHIITDANRDCYRAQCFATARALADRLKIAKDNYTVSFQSRLGRAEWIKPYTDELLGSLANRGIKRLVVVCPAFVADCLETIEEIGIRAADDFKKAGGDHLLAIPCVNSDPAWAEGVAEIVRETRGS